MGRKDKELESMILGYNKSKDIGDHEAASQWANQIGNYYKNMCSYSKALKWFKRDYDMVSGKKKTGEVFSTGELMTSCQCLGETYRRLNLYNEALGYQRKHYELALKDHNIVEQQRACTQLGGTYLDIFERDENDKKTLENVEDFVKARDYYKTALKLSKQLYLSSQRDSSYAKELVDSYNNLGMLKMTNDNWQKAKGKFLKALRICENEELGDSAPRSRVHHNLGRLYLDHCPEENALKQAKEHMQLDIKICRVIQHLEGEAKGYINLGRLHIKQQNHDDAMQCFNAALSIARKLEDEDDLVKDIEFNIGVLKDIKESAAKLGKRIQIWRKMQRGDTLQNKYKAVTEMFGLTQDIHDHQQGLTFAEDMEKIAMELGDDDKIGDAYDTKAQAYLGLRKYDKAKKWHLKAMEKFKLTKHLEGRVNALINYANALDSSGDENAAFKAYQKAYKLARSKGKTRFLNQQILAFENLHYIYSRREDARKANEANCMLQKLKHLAEHLENGGQVAEDENDTDDVHVFEDENEHVSDSDSDKSDTGTPVPIDLDAETEPVRQVSGNKKRSRIIILDEEEEEDVSGSGSNGQGVGGKKKPVDASKRPRPQSSSEPYTRNQADGVEPYMTDNVEPYMTDGVDIGVTEIIRERQGNTDLVGCSRPSTDSEYPVPVKINGFVVNLNLNRAAPPTLNSILDTLMQLYKTANPAGPHPELNGLTIMGKAITPVSDILNELFKAQAGAVVALVAGWREVPILERYKQQCATLHCDPNALLLDKLEKAEDGEIDGRECNLDDNTARPLCRALGSNDMLSSINLAHNRLGSKTINSFQESLSNTKETDIGLVLNYHDNKLSSFALLKMSICQTTLLRLEVLILSKNNLTDQIAHHLVLVLKQAPRLQTLEIEECGLTTATFEKLRDALQPESQLRGLSIGKNTIHDHALKSLLDKLSCLSSFANLDISNIRVNGTGIMQGVEHLIKKSRTLSVLVMKHNPLECWKPLSAALAAKTCHLVKIDATDCKMEMDTRSLKALLASPALLYLSLAGNMFDDQATQYIMEQPFKGSQLRSLDLSECGICIGGICSTIQSLYGNYILEELRLAGNASFADDSDKQRLVKSLSEARFLKTLDISNNYVDDVVDELYEAWCHKRRINPRRHVESGLLHFSVNDVDCCKPRLPCCSK